LPERILTKRELNRATLARQLLLARHDLPVTAAIERVAGLQAQVPAPPFAGLWTRLRDFQAADLKDLIASRDVVRATMMRHTVHLVTAADYVRLRGPIQPALDSNFGGFTQRRVLEEEVSRTLAAARKALAKRPHTFTEIQALIERLLPDSDHRALSYSVRTHLRLIAVPNATRWCFAGTVPYVPAEQWLGVPVPDDTDPGGLILRYLAAFGPATTADVQAWSGRSGLKPAVDSLRPRLRTFRDERGRELFDVPDGALPDGDVEAPARLLPDYDNTILSHADRTRIIADEHRARAISYGRVRATFLLDGFVAGTWKIEKHAKTATLAFDPFRKLTKAERAALSAEAEPLARFLEPEANAHDVRFEDPA
jgi:hypothetical protein